MNQLIDLELEGQLQGTTNNNGVEFGLSTKPSNPNELVGWVRYIIPGSDASKKDIKRGDIFYAVDGKPLKINNRIELLFSSNNDYTLNMADYNGGNFTPNGKSVALTKTNLSENPIFINTVINSGTNKIGYLMYNGFYSNYDNQLNDAFGTLKSQGITDLVIDFRYNGGGSVQTATRLASMITGSFTGKVFAKNQWNSKIDDYFSRNDPESQKDFFVNKIGDTPINSLNLTKVYILTSKASASASELVINGLKPYIEVIHIGDITAGKNVGSVTLYDSPDFSKKNANQKHRYAMQPIVVKTANSAGFGDYQSGLVPTFKQEETLSNLGVLGTANEPLLQTAISKITGKTRLKQNENQMKLNFFKDSKSENVFQNQMYFEHAPEGLLKAL
jgi:carboxyl-terminal processing protease